MSKFEITNGPTLDTLAKAFFSGEIVSFQYDGGCWFEARIEGVKAVNRRKQSWELSLEVSMSGMEDGIRGALILKCYSTLTRQGVFDEKALMELRYAHQVGSLLRERMPCN